MTKTKGYGSITDTGTDRDGKTIWLLRLYQGKDRTTNRADRPHRYFHGSKAGARRALAAWRAEVDSGLKPNADLTTFRQYADTWQRNREILSAVRPSTLRKDARSIRTLDRYIGDVALGDLDVVMLKRVYASMTDDGISADGIFKLHMKLKHVLKTAVNDDIIMRNPCERISVPKPPVKNPRNALSKSETARMAAILDVAGDTDSRYIGVRVGLATGMRIGEVLGLTWENVSFEESAFKVVQQYTAEDGICPPKTDAGIRKIIIDAGTMAHLQAWRETQREQLKRFWVQPDGTLDLKGWERFWNDKGNALPVVTDERGGYRDSGNYRRWFQRFCVANGYGVWTTEDGENVEAFKVNPDGTRPDGNGYDKDGKPYSRVNRKPKARKHYEGLKFHELRHTHFSLLAPDTDVKELQARGGWSSPLLPLQVYIHPTEENDRKAADLIGSIMGAASPMKEPPDKVVNI